MHPEGGDRSRELQPDPSLIEFPEVDLHGGQQIEPATPLPVITEPDDLGPPSLLRLLLRSGVGVTVPAGAAGLTVQADDVTVEEGVRRR